MEPSRETLLNLHRCMVRIRVFEEEAGRQFERGRIPCTVHLYAGQEAVAAGVMAHLGKDDQITSTHRGHGHLVAKGGDMRRMYAELFGRSGGYCKGKGGSMHVCDMEIGMLGANGIVAGGLPIAVGAAFSNRYRKTRNVACCFFGDGASNEGAFHEAANLAGLFKLPVLFVCENNGYGEFTPAARQSAVMNIADRAASYGMPGLVVDGMDAIAVWEAAGAAIARARQGEGPTLLECKTYRFFDHNGVAGMGLKYRTDEEVMQAKKRDPIALIEERLASLGVLAAADASSIREEAKREVAEAIEFAEASPQPDPSTLLDDVYFVPAK
jgi:acetoin:2,6-dichlorophenolindophenol oxidoreductase subunit alpha